MQVDTKLLRFMGLNTQGDFGPWTFYTGARQQLVFFIKAPPLEPPSPAQTTRRNAFRLNAYVWRSISQAARENWERASQVAHLKITGWNLFTYWNLTYDRATIATIERITGLFLLPLQTVLK